ncbi:MAG: hypothetical protein LBS45_03955 [Synergistaceae bacterium]|jgi:hypothetical protein|nr:hypothetical protein [Synergistaceae bacterium]
MTTIISKQTDSFLDELMNTKKTRDMVEEINDAVYNLLGDIAADCYRKGLKDGIEIGTDVTRGEWNE